MTLSPTTTAALVGTGLDPDGVAALAAATLAEDLRWGPDVTTESVVAASARCRGSFVARRPGTLAGVAVAAAVLEVAGATEIQVTFARQDGTPVEAGEKVLDVEGPTWQVLGAERSALNLLCHLSGVATLTRAWADALSHTGATVRDTRKTTPGLRDLEKHAVRCGGGLNHRMGLGDAALIKDNHIAVAGGVAAALDAVRRGRPGLSVEVECDTLDQVHAAVSAGADLVLLDNMGLEELRAAVAIARRRSGVRLEASGGLTLDGAAAVAATGVDYLAVGALTHSAPSLDIGLDLEGAPA